MKKRELVKIVHDRLYAEYGQCGCPLQHSSAFQLLAAVMLSAQCRDDRVNQVTQELFKVAPGAAEMAALDVERIAEIIKVCGLSGTKSRNLKSAAGMIIADFGGEVPAEMEKLVRLPGIGRKSANVILGNWFGIPGFPVDTHVRRLTGRIGLTKSSDPEKIESEITAIIAPEFWTNFSHLLITHGRKICSAGKRQCGKCVLADVCKSSLEKK